MYMDLHDTKHISLPLKCIKEAPTHAFRVLNLLNQEISNVWFGNHKESLYFCTQVLHKYFCYE